MEVESFNKYLLLVLGMITISIWGILTWDHFNGGVPSHHLLANKELPKISNWWGGLTVPLISCFLLYRIKKRIKPANDQATRDLIRKECYAFLVAIIYAIIISVSFKTGNTKISDILFLGLPVLAIFFPVYRASYLLGFIVGMMYTFGGVLPVFIGSIMSAICYLLFILIHPLLIKVGKMVGILS